MDAIFFELGMIMIIATVGGFISRLFKQPLIPAYVIAGIITGPVLGLVKNQDVIITFSEIGIAFLLFMVGLEIDLARLKDVGVVSLVGGSVQTLLLFLAGFGLSRALGFTSLQAFYLGIMLAFSSTMVVIKLFSDKRELDTLHGRIVLGILLVEDFFAIMALTFISTSSGTTIFQSFLQVFLKGGILILAILFAGKYILPRLFRFAASTVELLLLSSLSICFLFGILFHYAGLSVAIGSFLAGLILGNLDYNLEIAGRMRSLRDFFSTLFFVSLGMQVVFWDIPNIIIPLIAFIGFTLIVKPIIILVTTQLFGYKLRTSFMSGISLAQISEFSLIIVAMGVSIGAISNRIMTITVILAVVTITMTSYFIKFERDIYHRLSKPLQFLKRFETRHEDFEYIPTDKKELMDIILVGYDRVGYSIFKKLKDLRKDFLVIDFNPEIIKRLIMNRVPCIYGDVADPEILERLNLKNAKMIISTIPDDKTSRLLIQKTKRINKDAMIFVTSYQVDEALELYDAGADYVILPHFLGGDHFSLLLEDFSLDLSNLIHKKIAHIQELYHRKEHGHEHPLYDHNLHRNKKYDG
ncbi:hypothetical protein COV93_05765 [Candidatus Woesearchaeota archaeon CG11_big_fil_rev_8_21_14_0_20_43_8]|nr:MAG: hypothetical protein COV93_05765 [Candidatus Woesearchaeota archaeon CG11_big_fil_rev_8_21_14_0_20_43_8]